MLWHIMNIYAAYGFKEFVIALGFKGEQIKDYFVNYHFRARSLTVQLKTGNVTIHEGDHEDWIVQLLDTGRKQTQEDASSASRSPSVMRRSC